MMVSSTAVLKELKYISEKDPDIVDFLDESNDILQTLSEAEYNKVVQHLKLEIFNIEEFVLKNDCKSISNPRAFARDNIPSDDGLLSNNIFGITKEDRAGIFAYIKLNGWFLDPSCYKAWIRIDRNVRSIVHGTDTFRINEKGEFIQDPAGETGIEFLRKNLDKIKFKSSDSVKRDIKVQFLDANRDHIFINKYIVIPPFYRDKNTESSRAVGLGGINKIYTDLIVATNALSATQDYFFNASDAMNGRVQEIILNIYDWFCGNNNKNITTELGQGMSGKLGILRRTNMSKTANFSSRVVITAPELKVQRYEDMMVNFDKSAIPLASAISEFRDFIMFHTKRFFENEFMGVESYPILTKDGEIKYVEVDEPQIVFSDERIHLEMEKFIHGYNDRLIPIEIPVKGTKEKYYMKFNGKSPSYVEPSTNPEAIYNRRLTWCDVFYMACIETCKDKNVIITRFPIDSFSNQFTTGIEISSTKETEPMYFNDTFYKFYPKIREEDIGTDTSNMFIDSMRLSNLYLPGCGGDKRKY